MKNRDVITQGDFAVLKGKMEYERFKAGYALTYKKAVLAQCYVCNGLDEGGEDCLGKSCPLYQFFPYRTGMKRRKKPATVKQLEAIRRAREMRKAPKPN